MSTPSPKNNSGIGGRIGWIVAILIVAIVVWWMARPQPIPKPNVIPLTTDEKLELLSIHHRVIGLLELDKAADAESNSQVLTEKLPAELAPWRNLLVCQIILASGNLEEPQKQQVIERAQQTLAKLRALDEQHPLTHVLGAKLARLALDQKKELDHYQRMVDLAPRDPSLWYGFYVQLKEPLIKPNDPGFNARLEEECLAKSKEAFRKVLALDQDNLFLIAEAIQSNAIAPGPEMGDLLRRGRGLIQPFLSTLALGIGKPLPQLFETALADADRGEWGKVQNTYRLIGNLLRPQDMAQSDLRRLKRNDLAYLEFALSDEFMRDLPTARAETTPPAARWVKIPDAAQPPPLAPQGANEAAKGASPLIALQLADMDLDQRLDLVRQYGKRLEILTRIPEKNDTKKAVWSVSQKWDAPREYAGMVLADLDDDVPTANELPQAMNKEAQEFAGGEDYYKADLDVLLYGKQGISILTNEMGMDGRRTLKPVTLVKELADLPDTRTVVPADIDHDGDLDLVVASAKGISLWANFGNNLFVDITARALLPPADQPISRIVPVDFDRDLDIDLFLAGPDGFVGQMENLRHGRFRFIPPPENLRIAGADVWLTVFEGDGYPSWELALIGAKGIHVFPTRTRENRVEWLAPVAIAKDRYQGGVMEDFDNDGWEDLLTWRAGTLTAYRGLDGLQFSQYPELTAAVGAVDEPKTNQTWALGDLDGDGDLDLATVQGGHCVLWNNEGGNKNHWLALRLRGEKEQGGGMGAQVPRVNHYAFGSLLEVKSGNRYQAKVVANPVTYFGLGTRTQADVARSVWTNGVPQDLIAPKADQYILDKQILTGSCPYLYTWDGERFVFVTDLLWASPLGLQTGEWQVAPDRPWEYLLIPGEKLKSQNGIYYLRVTEELWEAAYFDHIQLTALDHPQETEVFTNEKVGPAAIATPTIHTVQQPRIPMRARNHRNRDLLPDLLSRDGRYAKPFDYTKRQGVAEEHFLELDLGDLRGCKKVMLYLTGWVFPTNTSINVQLSQDARFAAPQAPSLWVVDDQGKWQMARPFLGFPGGKTKTIAVDISDVFLTNDYRIRIQTEMEFYWDSVFFTVDESPAPYKQTVTPLQTAQLRYRGFSRITPVPHHAPDQYHYHLVDTAPKWPPMRGAFTRYGDVRELLTTKDDRLVVVGAGDEIALTFAAPEAPLPAGWKRDFVLHNVGWDKDADLNTIDGQTVEPLPFHGMNEQFKEKLDTLLRDPTYQDYLRRYQTRRSPQERFWQAMGPR